MSIASYYPFNAERGRLRLGLSEIDLSEWIHYEDDFENRIVDKKKIIKKYGTRVLNASYKSIATQKELLNLFLSFIRQYQAHRFEVSKHKVVSLQDNIEYKLSDYNNSPLELVSYLAADDFCLLDESEDDYELVAACVCSPTWWELSEKMNKPLINIHAPIANLEEKIGRMIRHFMKNLKPQDCYQRSNWFLSAYPDLCVFPKDFDAHKKFKDITDKNIEKYLYLRSERQTFRKLEHSKSIVFTIKVYVSPINIVKQHVAIADDLLLGLGVMTDDQKQAMGINLIQEPLEKYLQQAS